MQTHGEPVARYHTNSPLTETSHIAHATLQPLAAAVNTSGAKRRAGFSSSNGMSATGHSDRTTVGRSSTCG
jgi:hypothetical protein